MMSSISKVSIVLACGHSLVKGEPHLVFVSSDGACILLNVGFMFNDLT